MQPPQYPSGPPGAAAASGLPGAPPGQREKRRQRLRLWLAMGAGILALLCLGGVGVAVALYDGATEIKRTAPDAVTDNFLRAYLVNRDDERAALYMCKSGGNFDQIAAYRKDITTREKDYSVGIRVTWTGFTVATQADTGTVSTELIKTTADQSGRKANEWQFDVVDQDGWRVCGASQLS